MRRDRLYLVDMIEAVEVDRSPIQSASDGLARVARGQS